MPAQMFYKWQPAVQPSQLDSQSTSVGKKCQGPRVQMPVHITSCDVLCFEMQKYKSTAMPKGES